MTRSPTLASARLPLSHRVKFGIGLLLTTAVLCYFFPPLRVVRLEPTHGDQPSLKALTTPKVSTHHFWDQFLPASRDSAVGIRTLFDAIDSDPRQARNEISRQVGLGDTYFYFVRGAGEIEEITPGKVMLSIEGHRRRAGIEIGIIVGNTVCDATGWAKVNQFADLQSFNDLSSDLNRQIETGVLAPLRDHYKLGMRLEFVGCARINDQTDLDPLVLVPVSLKIITANEAK